MSKTKKRKPVKYSCWKCGAIFNSWQARDKHMAEEHKPPVKTTKGFIGEENHILLGGALTVKLGDIIEFPKFGVVTQITTTEGSNDIEVVIGLIKKEWSKKSNP